MGVAQDLPGFGSQMASISFKDSMDWFIHVEDPRTVFLAQPTYVLSEYLFYFLAVLTLIHSFIVGGRWKYFWVGTIIHGITTEMVSFALPDIDNYWHSQTSVMLLGRRLPLHIPLIYPSFMYIAAYTTSHMKIPSCASHIAAGLGEVLMDLPYDIICVKFVHWTWHDTDPNIFDRHYHVPWNSYYFHLCFGTAFNFFIAFWRKRLTGSDDKTKSFGPVKEMLAAALAGLCGMPGGVIQFMVLYHPLHDILGVPTENCVFLIAAFYFFIVWRADRQPTMGARKSPKEKAHWSAFLLMFGIICHYGYYMALAVIGLPERETSIGLHETTGSCNAYTDVQTAFGTVLKKRKFLCTKNYDEKYFDFHCLSGPPRDGMSWYTICGTPFENRAEYISMLAGICIVALFVFTALLFNSSNTIKHETSKVDIKYPQMKKQKRH